MFDHISIQCADLNASAAFFDTVLAPLGAGRVMEYDGVIGYGVDGRAYLWLGAQSTGEGFRESHLAFSADSRHAVDAFFSAARATGAEVLHSPRAWPEYSPDYYGAFVRDPDGNNVEAVCHVPAAEKRSKADARAVTRTTFDHFQPISSGEEFPAPDGIWSPAEWRTLELGRRAKDMDDKWSSFVEDERLYIFRSWTGHCIYEADFESRGNHHVIVRAVVTGDPDVYRRGDDDHEALLLESLIEVVLLGKTKGEGRTRSASLRSVIGRKDSEEEPKARRWRGLGPR